ncbi:MAG TPA: DNA ligase D [Gemmatimonadales bacterium]|nr:DNA ligase D [Gemmatimonadales bacterium]
MPANRKRPAADDPLSAYRAKRSVEKTPEPAGVVTPRAGPGGLFVVHQHAATRLHFDLRLEMGGVLQSWAVPKGPSPNPADKRLAVHVEDHPIEYGDFEGIIPDGNYGAGEVIVWDRGRWTPLEDPVEGMKKGKLLFDLNGYKLKGKWTLVKLKKDPKGWLLIKEKDGYVRTDGTEYPPESVLSGLTVEQLKDGAGRAAKLVKQLEKLKIPKRVLHAKDISPMLAETRDTPFSKPGWLFELKLDGYRVIAGREHGEAILLSRNGHDITATFPEIAKPLRALPFEGLVVDGELVVLDPRGHPSFQRLQNRAQLRGAREIRRAAVDSPASYFVFDLMALEGYDLRGLPLERRKALLAELLPRVGALRYSEHWEKDGETLYAQVERLGLEGIMAKQADSPYRSRRSAEWLKIRADRVADLVVVGFSQPKGSRGGFGALHVAGYKDGTLIYAGRVGTGFSEKQLKDVAAQLERSERPLPPAEGPVPTGAQHHWVEPELVVEVRYKEWTADHLLRQPVFLRFRDDKDPKDCELPESTEQGAVSDEAEADDGDEKPAAGRKSPRTAHAAPVEHEVVFSNVTKIFWSAEKYTKGDLIEYYRAISPWLLPYLRNRPVVLTRFPDGIDGKSFFQKDAPAFTPEWLRTERMWSEDAKRDIDYFVCDDEASLLYLANLASIPLHVWASRVGTLEQPDWCVLDLDPKGAPFADVVAVAKATRKLCDAIGLPSYIKTSGSTGLHVMLPLGGQLTYEQCRTMAGLLARVIAAELPDIATVTRQVAKRGGRVYLDYVQNGHGRLIVAPFSVRPLPGAPVSMPLKWAEVNDKLDLRAFTIKTAPARLKKLKQDPLLPVLEEKPDLAAALDKLQQRL